MATVKSPLLSLGASGSIGKTITFGKWKGINTARQTVTPSNPQTTGQVAQRGIMATVVAFWRGFMTGTDAKTAWNRDASSSGKAQSGFNAFTSASTKIAAQDADASMITGLGNLATDEVLFDTLNLDDGTTGDEAGDFTLNYGTSPSQMLSTLTGTIAAGELAFTPSPAFGVGDVIYAQVVKTAGTITAAKRSGIFQLTIPA